MHCLGGVVAKKSLGFIAFFAQKMRLTTLWATTPPKPCMTLTNVTFFITALSLNCVYVLVWY